MNPVPGKSRVMAENRPMQKKTAYTHLQSRLADGDCLLLDGGVATELQRLGLEPPEHFGEVNIWGTWALYYQPQAVTAIHRSYVEAGCDVISTNTWSILRLAEAEEMNYFHHRGAGNWMDAARQAIRSGRQAIREGGREGECALAFCISGEIDSPEILERLHLLTRIFREDPPDLILLETLSFVREGLTIPAVEEMLSTQLPVWLSFRRCREGVCGVFGQLWGGPEGDEFGRAARRFEQMGVQAMLINCLPVWRVLGTLPWLKNFVDIPLGVYPNLGHFLGDSWKFDENTGPEQYAELARLWRSEGAQLIGGCCGVTPEHISAAKPVLREPVSEVVPEPQFVNIHPLKTRDWVDEKQRVVYPLPFPKIVCDPGVFRPTQGSFLIWKYLFKEGLGKGKTCLEVGCGTGILAIQLALNGADQVNAMDIDEVAVQNTLTNAYRNGVADKITARQVDLYTYLPERRYDLVLASLYQMPVDPKSEQANLRPADFWGRNLLDHLLSLLPQLLEKNGVAYLMQISVLSQQQTEEMLSAQGLKARVVDFSFFYFSPVFYRNLEQIKRVTGMSDAFKLSFAENELMVMYLLEITRE